MLARDSPLLRGLFRHPANSDALNEGSPAASWNVETTQELAKNTFAALNNQVAFAP